MRSTYMQTTENARENRKWYVIDATDLVLGRLSVAVATKPPHHIQVAEDL